MTTPAPIDSICVYCGSSDAADPALLEAAAAFGRILAVGGIRLVYGGGRTGLMGACARGAHEAGGRVLGVMPEFLRHSERLFDEVETIVVGSMHERKMIMFEEADAFAFFPGGVGTLEEVVELISWRRLELHRKPMTFYDPGGFWAPILAFFDQTVALNLTPPEITATWRVAERAEDILPALRAMSTEAVADMPRLLPKVS
jgi:uncharacterized protein (TIGR00730 family)